MSIVYLFCIVYFTIRNGAFLDLSFMNPVSYFFSYGLRCYYNCFWPCLARSSLDVFLVIINTFLVYKYSVIDSLTVGTILMRDYIEKQFFNWHKNIIFAVKLEDMANIWTLLDIPIFYHPIIAEHKAFIFRVFYFTNLKIWTKFFKCPAFNLL